ncbi:MAG: Hint domain-containing protein [Amylibacter sp.]|nr:Hint domain-containing protein [Amylibacter sp.]
MPQTFTSFRINRDPLGANSLNVGAAETVTVTDNDGFLTPNTQDTGSQFSIGGVNFTSSAYPNYGGTGTGVEIYTATVNGLPVTFAYLTSRNDGVDDGVDRIVVLAGTMSPGDSIRNINLDNSGANDNIPYDTIPSIICFTPGILITTPRGAIPVEYLRVGDLVITADNGLQAIRWIGHKRITGARLNAFPKLRPIRIRKDAFGPGLPRRDMRVSPQHRMLIDADRALVNYGESEVLAPAKGLINDYSVTVDYNIRYTDYIHIMFDRHEIIFANDAATESFHPGHMTMSAIDDAPREELFEIFPELETGTNTYGPSARKGLLVQETIALGDEGFSLFAD